MKLKVLVAFLFAFVFFVGCKKETSLEIGEPARGSLKSSITGDCNPITVKGAYKVGAALVDTNYVDVEVTVAASGTYTISTDTINGYYFSGTGNFSNTGTNQVRLKGFGTPTTAGDNQFEVSFDTTSCFFSVTVLAADAPTTPAVFTLSTSSGNCMDAVIGGNYVKNTAVTSANTVTIEVNVTTPGTYSISTNSANGLQFSGTGAFANTGVQTAVLQAAGTPADAGAANFTVTAGSATCAFTVSVTETATPPTNNPDLFPLTENSWWSYENASDPADTVRVDNNYSGNLGGAIYRGFITSDDDGNADTSYFRKVGNDYFEYTLADYYTGLPFDVEQFAPILFLKEGLTAGTTWNSQEYSGSVTITGSPTQQVKLRYAFTCFDANATATINGQTFSEVYKIRMKPQVALASAPNSFADTGEEIERWYARGVGLIYYKITAADGSTVVDVNIRNFQIF